MISKACRQADQGWGSMPQVVQEISWVRKALRSGRSIQLIWQPDAEVGPCMCACLATSRGAWVTWNELAVRAGA